MLKYKVTVEFEVEVPPTGDTFDTINAAINKALIGVDQSLMVKARGELIGGRIK